jgi:anthranilate synthase component 1
MTAQLAAARREHGRGSRSSGEPQPRERSTVSEYLAAVETGKQAIRDGEVFQVVLSQRFDLDCPAEALDVYRVLRASNPSPYMYLYRTEDAAGRPLAWSDRARRRWSRSATGG